MPNINGIVKTEKVSFVTANEKGFALTPKYLLMSIALFVVLVIGILVSFFINISGLKITCAALLIIVFGVNGALVVGYLKAVNMSKRRAIAEEKGEYFSGKLIGIEKLNNKKQYVVKVDYQENGQLKTYISPRYMMNPNEFLVDGANCILVRFEDEIWIDSNQVKKTEYTGDWLEHFTVNSNGNELEIPLEQRFREWAGEDEDPTLKDAEQEIIDFDEELTADNGLAPPATALPVSSKKKGKHSDKDCLTFAEMKELFNAWMANGVPEDISGLKQQEVNFLIAFYDTQRVNLWWSKYWVGKKKYKLKKSFRPTKQTVVLSLLVIVLMPVMYIGLIGKFLYICFLVFVVFAISFCVNRSDAYDKASAQMESECHELKLYYKKRFHKHYIANNKYHEKIRAWLKHE